MAKQSFISHVVNGYSRYDVPESKAFTCTPGILYPVRIDFINARDRVSIAQGIDVRSNPLAVPSFNPYTVRLHRFWVPLQLYHPEMRTNSSKFDMNNLTFNWIPKFGYPTTPLPAVLAQGVYSNSLLFWLRSNQRTLSYPRATTVASNPVSLPSDVTETNYISADTYLAYWDIVRNYYGYSQWGLYSIAWPASWQLVYTEDTYSFEFSSTPLYFTQRYASLEYLDAFYESQFYPSAVASSNSTFNRSNLFAQIVRSQITGTLSSLGDGYPVAPLSDLTQTPSNIPTSQISTSPSTTVGSYEVRHTFTQAHPMAVVPSNPDRFSRLLPYSSVNDAVLMSGITSIPQLAVASRMQEYKDLLGAGGSRFSDWLETFFASKIEHVDRPKLLFSASQTVNVQVVMNQAGQNNFADDNSTGGGSNPLGQQGGAIAFNTQLGRTQSYYFREPGYMIDMLSIRPIYYWADIQPDYLTYRGADYFNPIYNDIGYQDVPFFRFLDAQISVVGREPCFNEFRSSYDEVLGQLVKTTFSTSIQPLYSYWVQQRNYDAFEGSANSLYKSLFVDIGTVNSPFISYVEDNFFVNLSYSVRKKNLVNKTFATRLSNR